jgi:cell division protein FtsL
MNKFSDDKEVGDKKQDAEQLENINKVPVKYDKIVKRSKTKAVVLFILVLILIILCVYLGYKYFEKQDEISGETFQEFYEEQLRSQIGDTFGMPKTLAMAPSSRFKEVKVGSDDGFGFMIANRLTGEDRLNVTFSYKVSVLDKDDLGTIGCDLSIGEVESWISSEKEVDDIQISAGEPYNTIVSLRIPGDAPLNCTVEYLIEVWVDDKPYDSSTMVIRLNEKKEEKFFELEMIYFIILLVIFLILLILIILIFF